MRAQGGAGLGLSIVAAIADAHGGRVSVAETPGGGATFAVDLPAEPDADVSKQWGLEGFPMIEPPTGNGTEAARHSSFAGGASSAEAREPLPLAHPEAGCPGLLLSRSLGTATTQL